LFGDFLNLDGHTLVKFTLIGASATLLVSLCYLLVLGYYWIWWLRDVSAFSLLSISLIYIVSVRNVEHVSGSYRDIVYSVLYCAAFLFTYEILYHFTWPIYLDYFHYPYGLELANFEYLALYMPLVVVPLYLMRKYIRFTRLSLVFASAFGIFWALWILVGFPQFFTIGTFYYPPFVAITDYRNTSLFLNYGSKLVLAGLFISLVSFHPVRRL